MSEAQCSQGATDPTWGWTWNRLGQDPCTIYRVLSNEDIVPLATGEYYTVAVALNDTDIDCSTVGYSLISACAGCQGGTWLSYADTMANCTSNVAARSLPDGFQIPQNTSIPHWAFDALASDGGWDVDTANSTGDTPESTATVTSPATSILVSTAIRTRTISIAQSIQSSSSASASATASPAPTSGSHTGAIAGGIVGGVLALIGLGAFAIYLRRRRRRRDVQIFNNSEAQMAAVPNNAAGPTTPMFEPLLRDHGHGSSGGSQAHMSQSATTMRYYNPSDPTTFPDSDLAAPPTATKSARMIVTRSQPHSVGQSTPVFRGYPEV